MKKFDLKKMIAENKATFFSSLNEGYDEFKRAEKGSKDVTAKDKGEEEVYGAGVKKGEEIEKKKMKMSELKAKMYFHVLEDGGYGNIGHQGVYDTKEEAQDRADRLQDMFPDSFFYVEASDSEDEPYNVTMEAKPTTKMKMSELKAKIKEMVLAELEIGNMEDAPESEVDFLAEIEAMLNENSPMNDPRVEQIISMLKDLDVDGETMEYILRQVGMEDQMANQLVNYPAEYAASLKEADKDTEKDTAETDVTVDDTETIDTETTTEVDPNVKAVQDALTQAQAAAQKLGDKKLTDQIGNTITFFTRTHVVEKPGGAME